VSGSPTKTLYVGDSVWLDESPPCMLPHPASSCPSWPRPHVDIDASASCTPLLDVRQTTSSPVLLFPSQPTPRPAPFYRWEPPASMSCNNAPISVISSTPIASLLHGAMNLSYRLGSAPGNLCRTAPLAGAASVSSDLPFVRRSTECIPRHSHLQLHVVSKPSTTS